MIHHVGGRMWMDYLFSGYVRVEFPASSHLFWSIMLFCLDSMLELRVPKPCGRVMSNTHSDASRPLTSD